MAKLNHLKDRRKQLGLTLQEVADKVGVSNATVSRWETGHIANMKSNYIEKYADALEVSPLFIMGLETENISEKENLQNIADLYPEDVPDDMRTLAELFELSHLFRDGLLTKEEFEIGKKFILEMMKK